MDHVEEMSLESLRKMQDEQEVMSETPGNATRGREEDAWTNVVSNMVESVPQWYEFVERETHRGRLWQMMGQERARVNKVSREG